MFTSCVLLKGLSLSRSQSLLTLFGMALLVTHGGCVRELTVMPDNQSAESTGTQEQGPEAGTGEVGTSTQAPTTSQATGTTSSAPVVTDSGTGEVTSGASSATETQEEDTGDPNAACVSDDQDRQCVPKAPVGWYGPVGLLQSNKVEDTRVCKAYAPDVDELFDEVTAPQSECKGCASSLEYPDSMFAQAVEHNKSSCTESSAKFRKDLKAGTCTKLEPDGDGKGSYWKVTPPQAQGELTCVGGVKSMSRGPRKKNTFFRGCQIEREGTCESEGQVCAKKGVGPTCIFRLGEFECPADYIAKRQLLYSGIEDTRGCSECRAEMKKAGTWTPAGRITFYEKGSCLESSLKRSIALDELATRCDSESSREKKGWAYARLELRQPEFSGVCESTGWKPQGGVKAIDPVTVCCRGSSKF